MLGKGPLALLTPTGGTAAPRCRGLYGGSQGAAGTGGFQQELCWAPSAAVLDHDLLKAKETLLWRRALPPLAARSQERLSRHGCGERARRLALAGKRWQLVPGQEPRGGALLRAGLSQVVARS